MPHGRADGRAKGHCSTSPPTVPCSFSSPSARSCSISFTMDKDSSLREPMLHSDVPHGPSQKCRVPSLPECFTSTLKPQLKTQLQWVFQSPLDHGTLTHFLLFIRTSAEMADVLAATGCYGEPYLASTPTSSARQASNRPRQARSQIVTTHVSTAPCTQSAP